MRITVYTKPDCIQCKWTKAQFEGGPDSVKIRVIDITQDAEAYQYVRSLGYKEMPVVAIDRANGKANETWSGFRIEDIRRIKKEVIL